ncbi:MAG: hypothetical protein CL912_33370 [Deltaproteobacteria bacterium]|nr:hypothetical protein [Deltaproteobacteria bacterium]
MAGDVLILMALFGKFVEESREAGKRVIIQGQASASNLYSILIGAHPLYVNLKSCPRVNPEHPLQQDREAGTTAVKSFINCYYHGSILPLNRKVLLT